MENANEANPNEEVNINEPSTSSAGPSKKRKRRSTAWDHFHIVSGTLNENPVDFAHCNYCTTKYQYSGKGINGSTGNLNSHTKKKHPERLNGAENLENNAEFVNLEIFVVVKLSHECFFRSFRKKTIGRPC